MKSLLYGKLDHIITTDTGEVLEFSDPRIQDIKKAIEEVFGLEIDADPLYFYTVQNKSS